MSTAPQDLQDAYDSQLAGRFSFAALIFIIYELVLALPEELQYVWTTPRSFTKAVYLTIRYYTIITLLGLMFFGLRLGTALHIQPERYCRGWLMYLGLSLHISVTLMEMILILRVYALYNRSRRLGWTLSGLFLTEQIAMLVCMFLALRGMKPDDQCLPTATPPVAIGYGLTPIFFEAVLLGLSLHKWYTGLRQGWGRVRAFRIFMRDGVWAFAVVFVAYALNGGFLVLIKGPTNGMMVPWQYAAASFAACRLVLHMQKESRGKRGIGSSRSRLGTTEEGQMTTSGLETSGMALTTIVLDDNYMFGLDGQAGADTDNVEMEDMHRREGIR